jgi:hypothetical protein
LRIYGGTADFRIGPAGLGAPGEKRNPGVAEDLRRPHCIGPTLIQEETNMPEVVSVTRAKIQGHADDVRNKFRTDVLQTFQALKNQGVIRQAFFCIDEKGKEAIGLAIYNDEPRLQTTEGKRRREAPQDIEDPVRAPTDFAKKRAKFIKDSNAKMEDSEWYELIAEV